VVTRRRDGGAATAILDDDDDDDAGAGAEVDATPTRRGRAASMAFCCASKKDHRERGRERNWSPASTRKEASAESLRKE